MKVRHTIIAAILVVATLGVSSPSLNAAEAVPLVPSATVQDMVAHPHAVRPPAQVKTYAHTAAIIPNVVRTFGRCVINHESRSAGLYRAQNPTSSASGAYQFTDGTWRHYARLAGFGHRYSRAKYAPPHVQDEVFAYAIKHRDYYNWKGTHCGYGT